MTGGQDRNDCCLAISLVNPGENCNGGSQLESLSLLRSSIILYFTQADQQINCAGVFLICGRCSFHDVPPQLLMIVRSGILPPHSVLVSSSQFFLCLRFKSPGGGEMI